MNDLGNAAPKPVKPSTAKGGQTKKQLLLAMISKPKGARLSTLCDKLGWQPHSVRGSISTLKKGGVDIERRVSSKGGEAVYMVRYGEAADAAEASQ